MIWDQSIEYQILVSESKSRSNKPLIECRVSWGGSTHPLDEVALSLRSTPRGLTWRDSRERPTRSIHPNEIESELTRWFNTRQARSIINEMTRLASESTPRPKVSLPKLSEMEELTHKFGRSTSPEIK